MGALSDVDVARFRRDGFISGVPVLRPEEARTLRETLEAIEREQERDARRAAIRPGPLGTLRSLAHRGRWWTDREWKPADDGSSPLRDAILGIARHPSVTDVVASVLGEDILARNADVFVREPWERDGVFWHRDTRCQHPDVARSVTLWLALTPSTLSNGALRYVPGSHRSLLEHEDPDGPLTLDAKRLPRNLLARAVPNVMPAGSASMHDHRILHASLRNRTSQRRIALAIRYLADDIDPLAAEAAGGCLVRGQHRSTRTTLVDAVAVAWP